jgi:lipoyl-dependent peroxiredoxin
VKREFHIEQSAHHPCLLSPHALSLTIECFAILKADQTQYSNKIHEFFCLNVSLSSERRKAMPMAERRADVVWEGNLTEGKGTITRVTSGALPELPITWASRSTERAEGRTSPEELIAAAHASCFAMALGGDLNKNGTPPTRLDVSAVCTLDRVDGRSTIVSMDLDVRGKVPGIDRAKFEEIANGTKLGCPVSRALQGNVEIRLKTSLEG